jgi:hypothetical protein
VLDGAAAVTFARIAGELTEWKQTRQILVMAAAYAEAGRFDEALKLLKDSIGKLPPDSKEVGETMRKMVALFETHKSYREQR